MLITGISTSSPSRPSSSPSISDGSSIFISSADDFKNKREMVMHIIESGEADIPKETGDAATKDLYKIHMIALGLNPV